MGAKESKAGAPPTRHQQESVIFVIFFFCRASRGRKVRDYKGIFRAFC
jgi:hypothetical protein